MRKRGQPFAKRTRYILGGTLVFAVGEFLTFLQFSWPIPFTLRAVVSLVLLMLIADCCRVRSVLLVDDLEGSCGSWLRAAEVAPSN